MSSGECGSKGKNKNKGEGNGVGSWVRGGWVRIGVRIGVRIWVMVGVLKLSFKIWRKKDQLVFKNISYHKTVRKMMPENRWK